MAVPGENIGVARIKVIGIGGAGSNAVTRMFRDDMPGVEFAIVNTDAQALLRSDVPTRLRIGDELTRGLGVGGDPERGLKAAEESRDEIRELVEGSDMVFIAAGMGGGTGTGGASVIAECAKEAGALAVAVVTRPFSFEGNRRAKNADWGVSRLKEHVDTLLVIPNDKLLDICKEDISWQDAFRMVDDILEQGILSITELITVAGDINLDFADVKAVMTNSGQALMAIGRAGGPSRASEAARQAIANPLLDLDISGATGVLLNITGGTDLKLSEVNAAAQMIREAVDPEANIIVGFVTDPNMQGEAKITIIATGFQHHKEEPENDTVDKILEQVGLGDQGDLDVPPFMRRRTTRRNV